MQHQTFDVHLTVPSVFTAFYNVYSLTSIVAAVFP